jgi:hypothetical protein
VRRRRHGRSRPVRGRLSRDRTRALLASALLFIAAGCQIGNGSGGGGGGSSFGGGAPPPQNSAATAGNPIVGILNGIHRDAGAPQADDDGGETHERDAGPNHAH